MFAVFEIWSKFDVEKVIKNIEKGKKSGRSYIQFKMRGGQTSQVGDRLSACYDIKQ